jgi:hypothetical protein
LNKGDEMASTLQPKILTFQASGVIARGKAVKFVASNANKVAVAAAATDDVIGIAQNAVADGEFVEVAVIGGGAKALAQTTIAAGLLLVPHTDGALKPIAAANNRVIALAMDDAVAGDIFDVMVIACQATGTE